MSGHGGRLCPCPFCGGDAELTVMLLGDGGVAYAAVCTDCRAETAFFTDEERAAEAWNIRADCCDQSCMQYAHDTGFDEGYDTAMQERDTDGR